jgi:hypothetical protein
MGRVVSSQPVLDEEPPADGGLSLGWVAPDTDNVLAGTPTHAGTFSLSLQVQDSFDNTATGTVTVTIEP